MTLLFKWPWQRAFCSFLPRPLQNRRASGRNELPTSGFPARYTSNWTRSICQTRSIPHVPLSDPPETDTNSSMALINFIMNCDSKHVPIAHIRQYAIEQLIHTSDKVTDRIGRRFLRKWEKGIMTDRPLRTPSDKASILPCLFLHQFKRLLLLRHSPSALRVNTTFPRLPM